MVKEDSLGDFHLKDGILYKLGLLCVPSGSYKPQLIQKAYHSKVAGHFRIRKTIIHFKWYVY